MWYELAFGLVLLAVAAVGIGIAVARGSADLSSVLLDDELDPASKAEAEMYLSRQMRGLH